MLTALSNLWKMIVKVLTLGTVKGNAYLDSKVSPLEKVDLLMKQAQKQATDRRHEFFKIAKSYEDSQTELEKAERDLKEVEDEIQSLLDNGNEERAKQQARLALQQSRYVDTLKANVVNFEKRKFEIQSKVDKLNTDVKILKSKRRELEMAVTMRDNSKSMANGELQVDGMDMSIDEFINEVESDITSTNNEETAWVETDKTFNTTSSTASNKDVDDYLAKFKK